MDLFLLQALTGEAAKFLAAGIAISVGVVGPGVGIGILAGRSPNC